MPTLVEVLRNFQPPTKSALADPIIEHFRNLPETTAKNAIKTNKMVQGVFATLPNGQPNPDYYPEAMGEFTQTIPVMGVTKAIKSGADLIPEAYKQAFAMEAKTGYRPNASEMDKIMKIQDMMANEKALRKEMLAKKIENLKE
jgi:hypothetical protein